WMNICLIIVTELDNEQKIRKKLLREIDRIVEWVNLAVENGLFGLGKLEENALEYILDNLRRARNFIDSNDLSEAEYYISLARRAYDKALFSVSRIWRFKNVYAGDVWIYFAALLACSIFILYYFGVGASANFVNRQSAISAVALGIIGFLF